MSLTTMRPLLDDIEFAQVLKADFAILFLDFEWSGQSMLSAAVVEEWERTSYLWDLICEVFRVKPDGLTQAAAWMSLHGKELVGEGGYGALVWLRSGVIVDFEPYVLGAGLREISRRTRTAFQENGAEAIDERP